MKFDKKVLKNWRWWLVTPLYTLPILLFLCVCKIIAFIFLSIGNGIRGIGKLFDRIPKSNANVLWHRHVLKWVDAGYKTETDE